MKFKGPLLITALLVALVVAGATYFLYRWGQLGGAAGRQNDLFVAIWRDETNKVADLLAQGADPNAPSNKANRPTPLIDAVMFGRLEIARLLLAKGADPNRVDRAGYNALYHALNSPYLGGPKDTASGRMVELLIEHGADLSGQGVTNAIEDLPSNDPRSDICLKTLANRATRTNAPAQSPR
jgi:ankyrin repeat protein